MEIRLLGPLEVEDEGRKIPLGGAKQRALFALLVLHRGRPVSTDRLIEAIWSGAPPETAAKSVQVYVSGLRKALGEGRIATRERGYELRVEPGEVDVERFDELVGASVGTSPLESSRLFVQALALVRGRPLEDVSLEPWAASEVSRLEEKVLAATEARVDADLALGQHRELVPELEQLVAESPYRERFIEQLMLALYRSGRQADALGAYRRGATRLRAELGLELGRSLRDLEAAILRQDSQLDLAEAQGADRTVGRRRRAWKLIVAGSLVVVLAAATAAGLAMAKEDAPLLSLPPGVALLDAETGALRAHISSSEIPQPVEVRSDSDSFWVWNLQPFSAVQIDPDSGEILRRVGSPFSGDIGFYLPEGRDLWFTGSRELVRVDVEQGRAVDRFVLTQQSSRSGLYGVSRCAGSIWVANNEEHEVLRVHPVSGQIQARIPTTFPWPIACGDGGIWVGSALVGLRRIDPETNTVVATAPLPQNDFYSVAVGGGYAWTTDETKGTVYKVDRNGRIVATYQTGEGARQLSFANGRVWVANSDAGTVTGIDVASGDERTFEFGHPVLAVGALDDALLVELDEGLTYEDRVDALEGDVARFVVPVYVFDPPDPALAWNPWIFEVERATCSTLLSYRNAQDARLRPDLAAALPHVSPDGRTFSFTVRTGARFAPPSNARVTAEAVRYSIERALSPKLGDGTHGIGFLDDLVGAVAFRDGRADHVRGIRVRGRTIAFTLIRPAPDFPARVSLPFFCTVPVGTPVVEGGVQSLAPPSAGPFYMSERENGEYMILRRNPNYDGPRPALDAIAFREGITAEEAVARVDTGAADGVLLDDPLPAHDSALARRNPTSGIARFEALPGLEGGYLALNAGRPLFADARIRRAAARAIDREALAAIWQQVPSASLLRPGIPGYRPLTSLPLAGDASRPIGERSRTARFGVPVDCEPCRRTYQAVRTALAPIGIRVELVELDDPFAAIGGGEVPLDIVDSGFGSPYPDGVSMLRQLVEFSPPGWLPSDTAQAIEALEPLSGDARDRAAARLATQLAVRDAPVIAYGHRAVGALISRRIGCDDEPGVLELATLCIAGD